MPNNDTPAPPCPRCKGPRIIYYRKTGVRPGDAAYYCPPCGKGQARLWRAKNQEYMAEALRQWRLDNPERAFDSARRWKQRNQHRVSESGKATSKVRHAIRKGLMARPTTCENCGKSGIPIEGAHFDYSRPFDVRWLCRSCHRTWDRRHPKTSRTISSDLGPES